MSKDIALITDLERAPGWVALSQEKREFLSAKTSNIQTYKRLEGLAALGGSMELEEVERALKGEAMNITTYVKHVYGGSARTAFRRLADLKELRKLWSDNVIKAIALNGAKWLRGATGSGLKDVINAARELPAPKSNEASVIEGFVSRSVREKLREQRAGRRAGKTLQLSWEDAAKEALNGLLRYMRAANLPSAAEKRRWLTNVVGWAMDNQDISGTLAIASRKVPDGHIKRRGRPPNTPST